MTLPRHPAVHLERALASGSSWPIVVRDDLGERWLVKLRGNAHGPAPLVAEVIVGELAAALGLADRVHYLDDGALGPLSQASLGMVTINSTSALVAFAQGKPVFAFGDAFYDGLTANRDDRSLEALDRFWSGAPGMEREIWLAFAGTMARDALVHGAYYRRDGLGGTCARVVERLERLLAPQVESRFESKVMPDAPASGVERGRAIT